MKYIHVRVYVPEVITDSNKLISSVAAYKPVPIEIVVVVVLVSIVDLIFVVVVFVIGYEFVYAVFLQIRD